MARPSTGKWILNKHLVIDGKEDCYVYQRPNSSVWQYFLSIPGEGDERKSTKQKDLQKAKDFALDRKLEVMSRQRQGLKARRVKRLFDFIDDFLSEEEKRISDYPRKGFITAETFRIKKHHLNLLRKFHKNKNIRIEDLDYPKLYEYPSWRQLTTCDKENPISIAPPKRIHTITSELTTIKSYFDYLKLKRYIDLPPTFAKIQSESLRNLRRDYLNPRQYQQTLNTIRSWSNSKSATPSQLHNRRMIYQSMMVMANGCLRIGELKGLRWSDIENNSNLSKEEQKIGHLIRIRAENTKTGESRTVQSPTVSRFEEIKKISSMPSKRGRSFPSVPDECMNHYVISKFNHPDQPMGQGTWDRCWKETKLMCQERYWGNKNISWYSFRHTGISFAVSRGVPLLPLSINSGTSVRYIQDVYYHHESESKNTWDTLTQNRKFYKYIQEHKEDVLVDIQDALDASDD